VLIATLSPGTSLAASDIQLIEQSSFEAQVSEPLGWLNAALFAL